MNGNRRGSDARSMRADRSAIATPTPTRREFVQGAGITFAIAAAAFLMSALAPRLITAWTAEDSDDGE